MPNPYANKVVFGDQVIIDLTNDDVLPADVRQGVHFHGADGAPKVGTSSGGGGTPYAIISVTYPSGSVCTCTKGSTVLTAADTSGSYTFECPDFGEWTVACTDGSQSAFKTFDAEQPSTNIALVYVPSVLNDATWAQVSSASASGIASNYWAVGDRKEITLNGKIGSGLTLTDYTTYVYILGFNHNGAANTIDFGTFKTALTGGTDVCLIDSKYNSTTSSSTYFNINTSTTNTNGWKGCRMRYYLLGSTNSANADAGSTTATSPVVNTLMASLPSDLRAVMKPMIIWTDNVGGGRGDIASNVTASVDYLPLLAEFEIFGSRSSANSAEQNHQAQYAYYANGASRIKYRHSATGSTGSWWERSPRYNNSTYFCYVHTSGGAYSASVNTSIGVAPIFRV